jgi:RNA polymerase sigma-70 factor, ECF subfamily
VVASAVAVQTALTRVPEEFRVAVVLCDLYRVPYADAAQILEIPVGTVKSRVFRGRLALAECLGTPPDADPGRPPLQVAGSPGTGTAPAASEPTAPDPTRSSSSVPDLHDHKRQG